MDHSSRNIYSMQKLNDRNVGRMKHPETVARFGIAVYAGNAIHGKVCLDAC